MVGDYLISPQEQKSTVKAIQSFIERIQEALENRLQAIGIFFLFNKGI
jgi:hypothetical protein